MDHFDLHGDPLESSDGSLDLEPQLPRKQEPPFFLREKHVREQLALDSFYRRMRSWPLIDITGEKTLRKVDLSKLECGSVEAGCCRTRKHRGVTSEKIGEYFPGSEALIQKYHGKIAYAGGIFSSILCNNMPNDLDIFFYSCTEEEAREILDDCVATLLSMKPEKLRLWPGRKDRVIRDITQTTRRIEKQKLITSVVIDYTTVGDGFVTRKYQFIHRIYPSLNSIIGGFDLGSCMAVYNGTSVFATPLGAFSIRWRVLIVDTTRESPSFGFRIHKYWKRGYHVIFPGLRRFALSNPGRVQANKDRLMRVAGIAGMKIYASRSDYHAYSSDAAANRNKKVIVGPLKLIVSKRCTAVSRGTITPESRRVASDYGNKDGGFRNLKESNGAALRNNNEDAICITRRFNGAISREEALRVFREMQDNPKIESDIYDYRTRVTTYRYGNDYFVYNKGYNLIGRLGEYHIKSCELYEWNGRWTPDPRCQLWKEVIMVMRTRMLANIIAWEKSLVGIKFITKSPGRQWTSSFNPMYNKPSDFYGKHHVPFYTGVPEEVETLLRLFVRRRLGVWRFVCTGVLRIILGYLSIVWEWEPAKNIKPSVDVAEKHVFLMKELLARKQ